MAMTADQARAILKEHCGDDGPVFLEPSVLASLTARDIPEGVAVGVGTMMDGVIHVHWDGTLFTVNDRLMGRGEYTLTRKYWDAPLGLPFYLDLVRREIETRGANRGDVQLETFDDDGAFVSLAYTFPINNPSSLDKAYDHAQRLQGQLEEAADGVTLEVGKLVSSVAQRLSGWGELPIEKLVEAVETAGTSDEKGRALEELTAKLFAQIDGFSVTGRVRTDTEEIDISILNDSQDPRFRREEAELLVECKNWSKKCGKNEFVIFKEKVENRKQRCSLGFLVSWNGFADTVTREMLRGSRENTLIVPLDGAAIRSAVRSNSFPDVLNDAWHRAVYL